MSDVAAALAKAVANACTTHSNSSGAREDRQLNKPLWSALDQIGIILLSVPEERGGAGGDLSMVTAVLEVLGEHGAAVPLAETAVLAAWLLAECGADLPDGAMSAAVGSPDVTLERRGESWVLDGEFPRVPWGGQTDHLVALVHRHVVVVPRSELTIREGSNLAGEPRDDLVAEGVAVSAANVHDVPDDSNVDERAFADRGTVARLAMMAGAAKRTLALSVRYASERTQFGRPIGAFQAVQQQLASMAGEVLVCKIAAEAAALALDREDSPTTSVAAAKVAAGSAAGAVARIGHQIHGAIGFTDEHELRLSTTRLWSWRDEFGTVSLGSRRLSSMVLAAGSTGLWPLLTEA